MSLQVIIPAKLISAAISTMSARREEELISECIRFNGGFKKHIMIQNEQNPQCKNCTYIVDT